MPGSDYFSARAAILDSIPLVTMSGRLFEERVALSLLSHLGDVSTVAASGRDYVDLAEQLAFQPALRSTLAGHLRDLLYKSPMSDMSMYVAHFEDAFTITSCAISYLAGVPPPSLTTASPATHPTP